MKSYNVLDLFAGCGGLSQGFEQAGFKIVAANEFWKPAALTYQKNHPRTFFTDGDITDDKTKKQLFDFFKNQKCHVIVGGPPCQAYSTAGLRNPDDPRGRLFEDYVEIVQKLKPDIFVMENVKGILTMVHDREDLPVGNSKDQVKLKALEKERADLLLLRKRSKNNPEKFVFGPKEERRLNAVKKEIVENIGNVLHTRELVTDQIVRRFKKLGYKVQFKLLNSADYGVPQKRQRTIFIGTRHDIPIIFPQPTHSKVGIGKRKPIYKTLQEWVDLQKGSDGVELIVPNSTALLPWRTVKEAIDDIKHRPEDAAWHHVFTEHNSEFIEKIRNTPHGQSVFGGYSDAFYRNPPHEPSRTVKENHGGVLVHYEHDRVMTPRELARLQTFPDDFSFVGSKSMVLKQIGNAVPVGLAAAIGKAVHQMMEELERRKR